MERFDRQQEGHLRLSDRIFMSGIWLRALIGRHSSYIVLAIVEERQTKDKRSQTLNVNAMSLHQTANIRGVSRVKYLHGIPWNSM